MAVLNFYGRGDGIVIPTTWWRAPFACGSNLTTTLLCIEPLYPLIKIKIGTRPIVIFMVGVTGFEPATPCTPCKYSTRLSYTPTADAYYYLYM